MSSVYEVGEKENVKLAVIGEGKMLMSGTLGDICDYLRTLSEEEKKMPVSEFLKKFEAERQSKTIEEPEMDDR